jgi:release factor glutamine methyltransferase
VTRGELTSELAASLGLRHEARFIVEEVLGPSVRNSQIVEPAELTAIRALAERRRVGEPLQYVLGHWAFRTLDLLLDRRVLIPRPETEQVVEVVLAELDRLGQPAPLVVDVGTGSGAIALALAAELPGRGHAGARLWATDASADALALAAENLKRVQHEQGAGVLPVAFGLGSWLGALPVGLRGTVDLIVSNPPYVSIGEWPDLPDDVRCEPFRALVAGDGSDGTAGLGDVEQVLSEAAMWLSRPGVVVVELAPHQAEAAAALASRMGYDDVRVENDLAQRPRALVGRAK